jgi:hypothetical protein
MAAAMIKKYVAEAAETTTEVVNCKGGEQEGSSTTSATIFA